MDKQSEQTSTFISNARKNWRDVRDRNVGMEKKKTNEKTQGKYIKMAVSEQQLPRLHMEKRIRKNGIDHEK